MWTRKELKSRAKAALKANYWRSVLVALILTVITASGTALYSSGSTSGGALGGLYGSGAISSPDDHYDTEIDENGNYIDETETNEAADPSAEAVEGEAAAEAPADGETPAEAPAEAAEADGTANAEAAVEGAEDVEVADAETGEIPPLDLSEYGYSNDFDYEAIAKDPNASVADLLKLAGVPENQVTELFNGLDRDKMVIVIGLVVMALLAIILVICIISFLVRLLLLNPLMVGCRAFFMLNSRTQNASVAAIEKGFTPKYGRNIGTILLMNIYQVLWTLLFIIPGIIKSYSYRMVPYILADDPTVGANEAITRSRQMMNGNKWRAFVLDLSFILWDFLSLITFGIVGIFYVNPYIYSTDAELYNALKGAAPEAAQADDAE